MSAPALEEGGLDIGRQKPQRPARYPLLRTSSDTNDTYHTNTNTHTHTTTTTNAKSPTTKNTKQPKLLQLLISSLKLHNNRQHGVHALLAFNVDITHRTMLQVIWFV